MQKQKKVTRGRDSCQMSWISNLLQPVSHTSAVAAYQHGAMQTQINDKHCARIHTYTDTHKEHRCSCMDYHYPPPQ